ncbi:MAG: tyrosine-type recombinase/integrase [Gaiellaceae bacterium]
MRVTRAIDRFLEQMQLERDFTDRSLASYLSVLGRLVDDPPRGFGSEIRLGDFEGHTGTDRLREHIGQNWGKTSSGRRANVISVHHTFWGWAADEGFIDVDPSARIKRPPRRKADVYRPPLVDQDLAFNATELRERAPWILMNDVALRAATVVETRWQDIDLNRGRISVRVKGNHRIQLPLSRVAAERLRNVYRELDPEPDDYVFTVEHHRFVGNQRVVKVRDPKQPATTASLWRMVKRICKRAGVRGFGPHALRHGFANRFLRESGRDVLSLQGLMGHAKLETTQGYFDELTLEELADALERAFGHRVTIVAGSGDSGQGESALAADSGDGPGWNRTTGGAAPRSDAEGERADDDRPHPLNDEKESH